MSEYQERHTVSRLIGAPPGYVGYDDGGLLTDAVRKTPHAVLLLDEIEKAHQDIYNMLLQIMDYATLTDNNGKKADFRNVILIMTSNAGAREMGKPLVGFGDRSVQDDAVYDAVERIFSPEFRNRLDAVVKFNGLEHAVVLQVVGKVDARVPGGAGREEGDPRGHARCLEWLALKGYSPDFGAREISRLVSSKLKDFFVDEILFGRLAGGGGGGGYRKRRGGDHHARGSDPLPGQSPLPGFRSRGFPELSQVLRPGDLHRAHGAQVGGHHLHVEEEKAAARSFSSMATRATFEAFFSAENIDSPAKKPANRHAIQPAGRASRRPYLPRNGHTPARAAACTPDEWRLIHVSCPGRRRRAALHDPAESPVECQVNMPPFAPLCRLRRRAGRRWG